MAKKSTRIGKSARGSVIHIIVEKSNRALCEKKQTGLIVDPALTVEDITCKRCMTTSAYKGLLARTKIAKEEEIAKKQDADKIAKEEEVKAIEAAKAKAAEDSKECFYKKQLRNGDFKIIHKSTEKIFFSNIEEEVVSKALKHLNEIELRWASKHDKIPKKFISKCRAAVALAYKQTNVTMPKTLEDSNEDKPKTRIIKRRKNNKKQESSKQTSKSKPSKPQKLLDFVVTKMHDGIPLAVLIKAVMKEFKLSQKKGTGKVKKTIRRLRKKDVVITIRTRPNKDNDFYLVEDD